MHACVFLARAHAKMSAISTVVLLKLQALQRLRFLKLLNELHVVLERVDLTRMAFVDS